MPALPNLTDATGEVFLCSTLPTLSAHWCDAGRPRTDDLSQVSSRVCSVDARITLGERRDAPTASPASVGRCVWDWASYVGLRVCQSGMSGGRRGGCCQGFTRHRLLT